MINLSRTLYEFQKEARDPNNTVEEIICKGRRETFPMIGHSRFPSLNRTLPMRNFKKKFPSLHNNLKRATFKGSNSHASLLKKKRKKIIRKPEKVSVFKENGLIGKKIPLDFDINNKKELPYNIVVRENTIILKRMVKRKKNRKNNIFTKKRALLLAQKGIREKIKNGGLDIRTKGIKINNLIKPSSPKKRIKLNFVKVKEKPQHLSKKEIRRMLKKLPEIENSYNFNLPQMKEIKFPERNHIQRNINELKFINTKSPEGRKIIRKRSKRPKKSMLRIFEKFGLNELLNGNPKPRSLAVEHKKLQISDMMKVNVIDVPTKTLRSIRENENERIKSISNLGRDKIRLMLSLRKKGVGIVKEFQFSAKSFMKQNKLIPKKQFLPGINLKKRKKIKVRRLYKTQPTNVGRARRNHESLLRRLRKGNERRVVSRKKNEQKKVFNVVSKVKKIQAMRGISPWTENVFV